MCYEIMLCVMIMAITAVATLHANVMRGVECVNNVFGEREREQKVSQLYHCFSSQLNPDSNDLQINSTVSVYTGNLYVCICMYSK